MTGYRIVFSREARCASYPGFLGFGGDYSAMGSDAFFDIARQMTDAGEADGPAVFVDEREMACLTVRSLHSCARRYRPTEADKAAKEARKQTAGQRA